jgi:hemolysin III
MNLPAKFISRQAPQPGVFFHYPPFQTSAEEWANGLTHAAAGVASLLAGIWLIAIALRKGDIPMAVGCGAYSCSLLIVFTMSALSHLVNPPRLRHLFRTFDQAAIYLLIAGSCTPFFLRFLVPHGWGWMLPVLWGLALLGAVAKLLGDRINSTSIPIYVLLGWFPVLATKPFLAYMPTGGLVLIVAAGAFYMVGVLFLSRDEHHRYFHAVWHLFVIAASVCTYAGIFGYVV